MHHPTESLLPALVRARVVVVVAALVAAPVACGPAPTGDGDGDGDGDGLPDVREAPPAAPEVNDDAFVVEGLRAWSLVGDALTPGHDALDVRVTAPEDVRFVDVWVGDAPGARLAAGDGGFTGTLALDDHGPGEVVVLFAADGAETAFARHVVTRTHPLYVVVGTDWDDADNPATSYALQDELHALHDELKITHFVGPYTFTDPTVSATRRDEIVAWLVAQRDQFDDEIGVHLHPYCNFVETTDVACRTTPSVVYDAGDPTGYTVVSASYTEAEYTTLLEASTALFEEHGLGRPLSFRAGAWTADLSTLRALVNAGYAVDSDAYNWARMEEWIGVGNGDFYEWVMTEWSSIGDTSQPYYPSEDDVLASTSPTLPLLEVPLNGVMADYVTGVEMMDILDANWDGLALPAPKVFAIGYHPPNYGAAYHERMLTALAYTDSLRASQDAGPVVYATFLELTQVWTR